MTDEKQELESKQKDIEARISDIKKRHRDELSPHEEELAEVRRNIGVIYAGFKTGDILQSKDGKKVRVTSVSAAYYKSYRALGINIRKDGTEGQERELYSWQGWGKVND